MSGAPTGGDVIRCMDGMMTPDTDIVRQAEAELKRILANPQSAEILADLLVKSDRNDVGYSRCSSRFHGVDVGMFRLLVRCSLLRLCRSANCQGCT